MEKRILGVLTIVFFILGMTGSVFAADKVTLMLNWFYVGDHSPYFVATEKGWYKDENLEVNIVPGKGWETWSRRSMSGRPNSESWMWGF